MKDRKKEDFFRENLLRYYDDIYRYVRSEVRDADTAQDITQNTIEKAWKYQYQLKKKESAKSWIFKIARNEILKFFKGRKTDYFYDEQESELIQERYSDLEEEILEILVHKEMAYRIVEAVQLLEPKYGQIIKLWALGDLSQKEIAEELHLNYNTVRVLLHRGLNELRHRYFALERGEGDEWTEREVDPGRRRDQRPVERSI